MAEPTADGVGGSRTEIGNGELPGSPDGGQREGPIIRDKRRLDPVTGQVRAAYAATEPEFGDAGHPGSDYPGSDYPGSDYPGSDYPGNDYPGNDYPETDPSGAGDDTSFDALLGIAEDDGGLERGRPDHAGLDYGVMDHGVMLDAELEAARDLADERLSDLQRLQAEYVNYKRRVERDRAVARDGAVASVFEALLPVLDDLNLARQHGDLEGGPFAAIAEKLESTLARLGLTRYGEPGETFDPKVHDALVHTQAELAEGTTETTVVQILQPGYRSGERILRAARVAVADPQ